MALVDPNIALSYRAPNIQPQNMMADYAAIQQIQGGQRQGELAQYQLGAAQRAEKTQNVLAGAYAQATDPATGAIDYNKLRTLVAGGGAGAQIPSIEKSRREIETAALTQQETAFKVQKSKNDFIAQAKRDTSQNPSDANITAYKEDLAANPLFSEAEKQQMAAGADRLLAMPVEQRRAMMSSQGASAADLKPSAPAAPPVSVAEFERAKTDPAFMKFLQDRAAATRAPRPDAAPRTQQVTLSDGSLGIVNMDTGVITPSTVGGAAVKGKPSAFAEKAAAQKAQMGRDVNLTIKELTDAVKDGGLIDQSTGSGAGAWADIAAGFVGKATPGAIAVGKLAPIADLALKMVPRFEGPQSDKDTMSYKQAAGQLANPSLPNAIRKEAGKTVLRLMQERKNQFASSDAAPAGVAPPAGFTPD
jgi:hypothetical protein